MNIENFFDIIPLIGVVFCLFLGLYVIGLKALDDAGYFKKQDAKRAAKLGKKTLKKDERNV